MSAAEDYEELRKGKEKEQGGVQAEVKVFDRGLPAVRVLLDGGNEYSG